MKFAKMTAVTVAAAMATITAVPGWAEYPEKPVQFVVPWPPGDMEDVLTRMIAEDFQAEYGVPAAVVNKPGGGGGPFPGAVEVASAPADGYTIGSFVIGVPVVGPSLGIPELSPDPFDPLGIFLTYPFVIVTSKDKPYSTMQELAAHAQDNPVTLAHFGAPLTPTKVTLSLAQELGFEYASDAAFDLVDCNTFASGDADVGNTTIQLMLPCLDDIQVLAAITPERLPHAPDAPIVAEIVPKLDLTLWNGLFVHKDTPADVREKIAAVAEKTIASERARKFGEETGAQLYWLDADGSKDLIGKNIGAIAKINASLGL